MAAGAFGPRIFTLCMQDKSKANPLLRSAALAPQTMTNLLYYALQARHTVLRQKKLVRFSNSNLYSDKRRLFF
jgi:hypothetical protein